MTGKSEFDEDLPPDVIRFLDKHIDSVEQLVVLLLLFSKPEKLWSLDEIVKELRSSDGAVMKRLDDLYSRKVLIRSPKIGDLHKFSPSTPEVGAVVKSLAKQNQ